MEMPELGWWVAALVTVTLLVAVSWWAHIRFWVQLLSVEMAYDSVERLPTADGSAIELRHVPRPSAAEPAAGLPPILMVHGLGANHRNSDLHPDSSLARHLAGTGRDVWVVTLRSGLRGLRRRDRRLVHFSAILRHDLPCAVDAVCQRTGASQVDYIGYSMGGMLLYAGIDRSVPAERIRRAVFIASPAFVAPPLKVLRTFRYWPNRLIPGLPLRVMARTWAFLVARKAAPKVFGNRRNVSPLMARVALVDAIANVPARLQADFARWAFTDGLIRVDGEHVLERLEHVQTPALFLAGTVDTLAPAHSVRLAYEAWGKNHPDVRKDWRLMGRSEGYRGNYGHGDFLVGVNVHDEVFVPVTRYLAEVDAEVRSPASRPGETQDGALSSNVDGPSKQAPVH
jgi:polyhydroxyalkanoate synthase subunit PhaC